MTTPHTGYLGGPTLGAPPPPPAVPPLGAPAPPPAFWKNAPRSGDHTVRGAARQHSEPTP